MDKLERENEHLTQKVKEITKQGVRNIGLNRIGASNSTIGISVNPISNPNRRDKSNPKEGGKKDMNYNPHDRSILKSISN